MKAKLAVLSALALVIALCCLVVSPLVAKDRKCSASKGSASGLTAIDLMNLTSAKDMFEQGRDIFRFDTFGDEVFWGDMLQLHKAIAGVPNGGVGPGVSPAAALAVGLKVDVTALPQDLQSNLRAGRVDLNDPAVTLALLRLDAVLGVKGFFDNGGNIKSIGITCAICHSTVDNSFAPGIGRRLDGWANRDLDVGAIISLAPNKEPLEAYFHVDEATLLTVLQSWGPGKFDALLDKDGKAFRPDGKTGAVLLPPAFGLAGVNLHTWTGMGSVPYWNAYVAVTEMHGMGTFFDERLNNPAQYPLAVLNGTWNVRNTPDLVTSKLPALHFYQISLQAPRPPKGSFDEGAAARGKDLFNEKATCARCHVPTLYTEPGHNIHKPEEICIDSFQSDRSPTFGYRTPPLKGLWTHTKGGFYHDGRFPTLLDVVNHYDSCLNLGLSGQERNDLVEYLKSL